MAFSVPGYQLDRPLGAGAQAEVWLARHRASGDQVAVKRLRLAEPGAAELAEREASLLAVLDHPNLIRLREFHALSDGFALVLELASAGSLAGLLLRRTRLTPAEVVATVAPIAAALAHAHDMGVLHGDVSAANVLFTAAGHPKLADLGLARIMATAAGDRRLGTPAFLDPVVAGGGPATPSADVFALAAVTLLALTGAGPWYDPAAEQPGAAEVIARAATGQIDDLSGRLAAVAPDLARAVRRGLHPDPARRGSAAEFALDIAAAQPASPVVLAGGRIGVTAGRHSESGRAAMASSGQPGPPAVATGGIEFVPADLTRLSRPLLRPATDRPGGTGPPAGAAPASGTGRRAAFVRCAKAKRASTPGPAGRRWGRPMLTLALTAVVLVGMVIGWPAWHRHTGSPRVGAAAAEVPAAAAVLQILNQLDATRGRAYAERKPELLAQVYPPGPLLSTDRTALQRLVPVGCTLTGLRSQYRLEGRPARLDQAIELVVVAALPAAKLSCAGRPRGSTPAIGPVRLAIRLVAVGGDYLIARQSRV